MFLHYLTITLRVLRRHAGYACINVAGLAIGMACCLLILLYVRDELSYDRHHPQADRIYRVLTGNSPRTAYPVAEALIQNVSEIEQTTRVSFKWERTVRFNDTYLAEPDFVYADPTVFEVFSFPFLEGDPRTALQAPFSIVLTETTAKRYFRDVEPLGKILTIDNTHAYTVTGVLRNIPSNSHFRFDFMATFEGAEKVFWPGFFEHWGAANFFTYVLLPENGDMHGLESKLTTAIAGLMRSENPELTPSTLHLQPLTDIRLYSADYTWDIEPQGDIRYVATFATIAVIILLIACMNYTNLATARALVRTKEVGVRKVVGASRSHLRRQFMGESLLVALIGMILALGLAELLLPAFTMLTGKSLMIDHTDYTLWGGVLGITLLIGILSGSYPAFFLSAFQPVAVLKGPVSGGRAQAWMRQGLVITQFTISITLIIAAVIVWRQLNFLKNQKLAVAGDQIVVIDCPDITALNASDAYRQELLRHPAIVGVTRASHAPPDLLGVNNQYLVEGQTEPIWLPSIAVYYDYFSTLGLEIIEGRAFSMTYPTDAEGALILNESAAQALELESPLDAQITSDGAKRSVVGIVKDFYFEPLYQPIKPMVFRLNPMSAWRLIVRMRSDDVPGTLTFVKQQWTGMFPGRLFRYQFVDERIDRLYSTEEKTMQMISGFATIAIVIACLGLVGLASYTVARRTKEIGIRKVLGAAVPGLIGLLSSEFVKLVLMANVLAWPVAYLAMHRWLQAFPYRVDFTPGVFLFGGGLALLIAVLTVSTHALKAARANPVDALRYE